MFAIYIMIHLCMLHLKSGQFSPCRYREGYGNVIAWVYKTCGTVYLIIISLLIPQLFSEIINERTLYSRFVTQDVGVYVKSQRKMQACCKIPAGVRYDFQ